MTNIHSFRNDFKGTRSNRFSITPSFPADIAAVTENNLRIYGKATSYPGSQIGMIPVSYQGRVVKYSGERQFAEWSIQVYDSATTALTPVTSIRKIFEDWISRGDQPKTHVQRYNNASPNPWEVRFDDIKDATTQGSDAGGAGSSTTFKKVLYLFNCWPIDISPIDLSYEAADSFAEFTLTFAYDFHKKDSPTTT
jgi:hypothetical protein